jgi:DnaD/phage-associated family protein
MSIFRIKKTTNYTVLSNDLLCDSALTFEARGMLCYLLSKPHNWEVRFKDLIAASPAGMRVVRRIVGELEESGYMKRQRIHKDDGSFTWITEVYEDPTCGGISDDTTIGTDCIDGNTIGTDCIDGSCIDGKRTDIESIDLKSNDLKNMKKKGNAYQVYEQEIGPLTPMIAEGITRLEAEHTGHWVCESFRVCSKNGKRSLGYAEAILKRWKVEGYGTAPKWESNGHKPKQPQPEPVPSDIYQALYGDA